jgi:Ca-activated chloride channel family protein
VTRTLRVARTAFVVLAAWLGLAAPVAGQATFSAGVNTVATYVTVVRKDGKPNEALTAADFELLDDGQPRKISVFQAGSLPITVVVLLDESPSMRAAKARTESAAAAFVKRLVPQDRATVGKFSRTIRLESRLTNDANELLDRVKESDPPMAGTALWDALNAGLAALEDEAGRRVMLVLSDGDDNSSETSPSTMISGAIREGVMVYAIGIRGAERRLSAMLRDLARDSGGSYFELKPKDDIGLTFQRLADELHSQYLLGFSLESLDGQVHQLKVKVKKSGYTARTRKSYVASTSPVPH